jgi:predicted RNase H-like HicB family nuclease
MSKNLKKQAEELAARRYLMFVFHEMTTEDEPIYVALNPELDGCFAQGETSQEARENLNAFRVDYIHHLLSHGLPVPEPAWNRAEDAERELPEQFRIISLKEQTDQQPQEEDLSTSSRIAEMSYDRVAAR